MANVFAILPAAALALALATGCRIDQHKEGNDDNFKVATPFGGMSLKTNQAVVENDVGLSVYPGAVAVKKEQGKETGAADINMSFGSFHLGVRALSYRTPRRSRQGDRLLPQQSDQVRRCDPMPRRPCPRLTRSHPGRPLLRQGPRTRLA